VGGDAERGLQSFFDTFDEETFIARSMTSEQACPLILAQLHDLVSDTQVERWRFGPEQVAIGKKLIADIEGGAFMP